MVAASNQEASAQPARLVIGTTPVQSMSEATHPGTETPETETEKELVQDEDAHGPEPAEDAAGEDARSTPLVSDQKWCRCLQLTSQGGLSQLEGIAQRYAPWKCPQLICPAFFPSQVRKLLKRTKELTDVNKGVAITTHVLAPCGVLWWLVANSTDATGVRKERTRGISRRLRRIVKDIAELVELVPDSKIAINLSSSEIILPFCSKTWSYSNFSNEQLSLLDIKLSTMSSEASGPSNITSLCDGPCVGVGHAPTPALKSRRVS